MKTPFSKLAITALITISAIMPLRAEVSFWVRANSAPFVFVSAKDALASSDSRYARWPGQALTGHVKTSDGATWWLCTLSGTNTASIILNNGNRSRNPANETAVITGITSSKRYFYYNNYNFYLDITATKDAAAYAFLQPYASVDWTTDGAIFKVDGSQLVSCGGYNNGSEVFLWTNNTEKNEGSDIVFQRCNPSSGDIWNSFSAAYYKGGFYETSGWDSGFESDTQYRALVFHPGVAHDSNTFPDDNFRSFLTTKFPTETADGWWTPEELAGVKSINCSKSYSTPASQKISILDGIQHFASITILGVKDNLLNSLDVSQNTALTDLDCSENSSLTSLDLSNNTALTTLDCSNTALPSLDLSNNIDLTELTCKENQWTALDVSHNTALKKLDCGGNKLPSLDVTHNTALTELNCGANQLPSLDVSLNTALSNLTCGGNLFTSLDLSHNTALTNLSCTGNKLAKLDLTQNTLLRELYCGYTTMKSLILPQTSTLQRVNCENALNYGPVGKLPSLDVTHNPGLKYLYCSGHKIPSLDVTHNPSLVYLDCDHNLLPSLDVSQNPLLTTLYCQENQILSLDATNNTNLKLLVCGFNLLTELILPQPTATNLSDIRCQDNQLTEIDVTPYAALKALYCSKNQLSTLDVTKNTALTTLYCNDNQLTSLNVSNNTALKTLSCYNNQLASLDVTKNTKLTTFECQRNHLTSLDISKNTLLTNDRNLDVQRQTVDIGRIYQFTANGKTYYYVPLDEEYKGGDRSFTDIVLALQGHTTASFIPFTLERVQWRDNSDIPKGNCELFHGTAQIAEQNGAPRRAQALSDGLDPDHIYGDILLFDGTQDYISYNYDIHRSNKTTMMDVTMTWTGADIPTAINIVEHTKDIATIHYINLAGVGKDTPWDGINIVITTYDDGTQKITKAVY